MKVVFPKEMMRVEHFSYEDGASDLAYMEEAGRQVANAVGNFYKRVRGYPKEVILLLGKGNNAGDAYVAGRQLIQSGFHVHGIQMAPLEECSTLTQEVGQAFIESGGSVSTEVVFPSQGVILDGLFGTGFRGEVKGAYLDAIRLANGSHLPIFAIDIPSGLDGTSGAVQSVAIRAHMTITLGLPKVGLLIDKGLNHVGILQVANFGLGQKYVDDAEGILELLEKKDLRSLVPDLERTRHKYEAGEVVGWAGSSAMPGAAVLASHAALRSGAGMMRLLCCSEANLPPEVIRMPYSNSDQIIESLSKAKGRFIGPGLDLAERELFLSVIQDLHLPAVIDASALTLLAEENLRVPKGAVLTPHFGEMKRLLDDHESQVIDLPFLKRCQEFVEEQEVTLVLKGASTFILRAGQTPEVSIRGNAGMATAGSGDVLTGVIAGLMAQGLTGEEAAKLGVYLHGIAGESAARDLTPYSLIASDLIAHLGHAFQTVLRH